MKCPKCGSETNGNYCSNCGTHIQSQQEEKHTSVLIPIVLIAIIIIAGIFIYNKVQSNAKSSNTPTTITKVTKTRPSVTYEQTLTGVKFTVQANDNYDEVQVVYQLYNSNNQIIKQGSLYGTNYRKGNSYVLSENLSFSELLNTNRIEYNIGYYK